MAFLPRLFTFFKILKILDEKQNMPIINNTYRSLFKHPKIFIKVNPMQS